MLSDWESNPGLPRSMRSVRRLLTGGYTDHYTIRELMMQPRKTMGISIKFYEAILTVSPIIYIYESVLVHHGFEGLNFTNWID